MFQEKYTYNLDSANRFFVCVVQNLHYGFESKVNGILKQRINLVN